MKNSPFFILIAFMCSCNLSEPPKKNVDSSSKIEVDYHEHEKDHGHEHHSHDHHEHAHENAYDAELAKELGADDYGMRKYVIAFLKAGPNRDQNEDETSKMQIAHMENISRLAEEGLLVAAGPFLDNETLRGIYIFDVPTIEEARKLTETDPMIKSGRLEMELNTWYGSAALKMVNGIHEKIQSVNISAE